MITKDIESYLASNYSDYRKTVSELSRSDEGKVLVKDERKLYCFDDITEALYPQKTPDSVDAVYATNKKVFFVEYKSGFKKKISKSNFNKKLMSCYDDEEKYCEAYAKLFFKNQKNEDEILRHSIHFKAVESYITFIKEIIPKCEEDESQRSKLLIYCVVIDDYVENMEDILNDLAKKSSETNTMESIRKSLSRFRKAENKDYYYDDIKVLSPHEFIELMNQNGISEYA